MYQKCNRLTMDEEWLTLEIFVMCYLATLSSTLYLTDFDGQ